MVPFTTVTQSQVENLITVAKCNVIIMNALAVLQSIAGLVRCAGLHNLNLCLRDVSMGLNVPAEMRGNPGTDIKLI